MANISHFFESTHKKTMKNKTNTPTNVHIDFRADFAVALWLIDYLRTTKTIHHEHPIMTEIVLEPLLQTLQANPIFKKPSIGYLTPIQYLKQLCLNIDPNILVPALVNVLNQITLDSILKNSRAYTSFFLNITPHTLSEENIRNNHQCLNPLLPSVISKATNLSFNIITTSENKILPKKHPQPTPMLSPSTSIKLYWQNGRCFVSTDIIDSAHFKNLDKTNPPPTTPLHLDNLEHYIKHLKQEATRSIDVYHATRSKLIKYLSAEKKTDADLLRTYFDYLNKNFKQPSKYFDTLHGTQAFFMQSSTYNIPDDLKGTITRLLALGEQLDMSALPSKNSRLNPKTVTT